LQERYYKVIGAKEVKTEKCYILYRIGDVYFQLKEYDKTIRFYEKALNTDYVSKSRLLKAILAFDKCLKTGIDDAEEIKMRHPTLYEEIMNKYKSWEKVTAIAKKSSST
jgi:tetratricopeptide (TPR) repeat protein